MDINFADVVNMYIWPYLSSSKNGNFIIIQVDPSYENSHDVEFREIFGITISQKPNKYKTNYDFKMYANKKFEEEINRYSYNWTSGGQFSKKRIDKTN